MTISIVGMILSIGLNIFFVRSFGALGATYTSIAVYFSMAVVTMFFVNKYYRLNKLFMPRKNLNFKDPIIENV